MMYAIVLCCLTPTFSSHYTKLVYLFSFAPLRFLFILFSTDITIYPPFFLERNLFFLFFSKLH
ncbi:hypothetical protein BCR42DRAFT_423164 [Absidia repens]|uniref:Uncharacterized protein n=1 Tax=Absidia repens TaxID=90262 RepID=A0A1X2I5I3_9FUNG|nr:hypothetical protein BCR42DRAFT_423164 [Absidia repens]